MPHRPARARTALALVATAALTTTLLSAYVAPAAQAGVARPAAAAGGKALTSSDDDARRTATTAVTTARAIAAGRQEGDLTMALREVANTRVALSGAERARAERLLARPTDPPSDEEYFQLPADAPTQCTGDICVHYVTTGPNAVTLPYVALVLETLTDVHDDFVAAGYREPLPDGTRGGDARFDVYLGDIGDQGLYGYCTSDQPEPDPTPADWNRWAYCALDNDYNTSEFPTNTPTENLQVTVAHEYFHAVQYAYDRYEDSWLLEATAAWVEDELYDGVDDNLQYLRTSQLRKPQTSLDTYGAGGFHYGTWSFFRFLTEKYPARVGRLPRLVLDVFRKADGALGKPDQYSWQAVDNVLRAKGTSGAAMLGKYAVANRRPGKSYSEGRANRYPAAPLVGSIRVTPRKGVRANVTLNHLATATGRLVPKNLGARGWKLKLAFDLAPLVRGGSVLLTTTTKAGKVSTQKVRLNKQGNAVKRVPFSSRKVAHVEVTLVNGSGRFRCFVNGAYSCQGRPKDQRVPFRFTAFAVRR